MSELILITGGAGFIGSHTADQLLAAGYCVRVLDLLIPQVHEYGRRPGYLAPDVELLVGNICDPDIVRSALDGVSYIYHFAAETGVGQSMYALKQYFLTNVLGTSILWEEIKRRRTQIKKVILSSSRAVYGEGKYNCAQCGPTYPGPRMKERLLAGDWWHYCPTCNKALTPVATDEKARLKYSSVYGLTKFIQEEISTLVGRLVGVPVVILRYFNVYGPRQSLNNAYTGVIAAICTKLLTGSPFPLYEEGYPARDFVHVSDVVQANLLALEMKAEDVSIFNVGSGQLLNLRTVVEIVAKILGRPVLIEVTRRFRMGDVFSCYADLSHSRERLGYVPRVPFHEGVKTLLPWLACRLPIDNAAQVELELRQQGILLGQ